MSLRSRSIVMFALGERLLELLLVRELLLHLLEPLVDLGVGGGDLAALGLLRQHGVGDQLVERAAEDLVAPLGGNLAAGRAPCP